MFKYISFFCIKAISLLNDAHFCRTKIRLRLKERHGELTSNCGD